MGAELRIESLYDLAWKIHGDNYRQAVADRDQLRAEIQDRFGSDVAAEVQRHVDLALGRLQGDELPDLDPAAERASHQLRALEMAIIEIESRIEVGCVFYDPYVDGLFPMSWWQNVVSLLPENPGFMPVESVAKFFAMVLGADHRMPSGDGSEEMAEDFRRRRRELIEFLERAVKLGEAVWCDL